MYATPGSSGWYGLDMFGQGRTIEADASACQSRCARTDNCEFFTFWPSGHFCHLQSKIAVLRRSPGQRITQYGPVTCQIIITTTMTTATTTRATTTTATTTIATTI